MPFKETCPVEERIALFRDYETGVFTVSELCRRHGISRETFYVWKRRRESGEARWFEELSHATASCPHARRRAGSPSASSPCDGGSHILARRRSRRGWKTKRRKWNGQRLRPLVTF